MTNLNKYAKIFYFITIIGLTILSGYYYYIKIYDRATYHLLEALCLVIIYGKNN